MNRKNAEKHLNKKFEKFLASIPEDQHEVRTAIKENTIISGGAIASLLLGDKVHDYDMYFKTFESAKIVSQYFIDRYNQSHTNDSDKAEKPHLVIEEARKVEDEDGKGYTIPARLKIMIKSVGIASDESNSAYDYFENHPDEVGQDYIEKIIRKADDVKINDADKKELKKEYRPIFLSANAITLTDQVQLINRFYGEPDNLHENYDYVHCTNYWTSWDKKLTVRQEAVESLLSKQLEYIGSKYPVCSIIRMRKFLKRGWYINAGQILKMCFQVSELDLSNLEVLEDQLTGVDTAYFTQLIDYCKEQYKQDQNFKPDGPYIASLVDKLF